LYPRLKAVLICSLFLFVLKIILIFEIKIMGTVNRDVRSYEGTSIKIRDEVNLDEETFSVRYYKVRDFRFFSVSVSCNRAGISGNLRIGQTLFEQEQIQELSGGVTNLALVDQGTAYIWGIEVDGDYIALDFSGVTLPADGKLVITILGKRN
jgi:hypothetical protein